ncbi:RIP metalloprotease RseP [Rubellicoccus peritrichatus]|uniref:RIP metalloprotease RseP n=1 Tax=Rubellicoccus peritrichatus TaxID=3080537 RepID=A0AAQ3L7F0_9BACT|nr:RIP metalloprotease RseP [Puniceicoccus sp. CR14]WOO40994.1 RIP metalloprotease RseP [Puniceicoccus sp. CR14]
MSGLADLLSNTWGLILVVVFFCGAIFFHELGHFLAAKWRGLKIERFSIGFGPRLFGWKGKDGVDYRVSLLPLGGYVALPQLADMRLIEGESETPSDKLPPIGYWDKMIVAVAGPAFNVILATFLAIIVWIVGFPSSVQMQSRTIGYVFPTLTIDEDVTVLGPAAQAGLKAGDEILEIDGKEVDNWSDITKYIVTGSGRDSLDNPEVILKIRRGDEIMDVNVSPELNEINARSGKQIRAIGIYPGSPLPLGWINPNSPAEKAGLKVGDIVETANGKRVYSTPDLNDIIEPMGGKEVVLGIVRDGKTMDITVVPEVVPVTKALLQLTESNSESPAVWEFLPKYLDENAEETSLTAKANIVVFDAPISGKYHEMLPVGAVISKVNGQPVDSLETLQAALAADQGETTEIAFTRKGVEGVASLDGSFKEEIIPPTTRTLIGFSVDPGTVITYPNPVSQVRDQIEMTFLFIGSLLSPNSDVGINQLSGPVGIGRVLHTFSLQDLRLAIWFSVLLNINLAILNLMPIPVLDGGHMTIATITRIIGKAPPINVVGAIQGAVMLMLFGLMFYVMFNDSMDWLGDHEAEQNYLRDKEYQIPVNFSGKQ